MIGLHMHVDSRAVVSVIILHQRGDEGSTLYFACEELSSCSSNVGMDLVRTGSVVHKPYLLYLALVD